MTETGSFKNLHCFQIFNLFIFNFYFRYEILYHLVNAKPSKRVKESDALVQVLRKSYRKQLILKLNWSSIAENSADLQRFWLSEENCLIKVEGAENVLLKN